MKERAVARAFSGIETMDGAGVRLIRMFGHREARLLDPFLLLDLFGSDDPDQYLPGFPWHPHRGIETVTYMLEGTVRHGDSMGNSGFIGPGDLQWMTAGSGIIHEEMPQSSPLGIRGFQLWLNLPAAEKMRDPAYRGYGASQVAAERTGEGEVRVLAGRFGATRGPVQGLERDPMLLDLRLGDSGSATVDAPQGATAFACLYGGSLVQPSLPDGGALPRCILFGDGDAVRFKAGKEGCSLIFACALPLREEIAWGGPIVMNTQEELERAFREYEAGTFVKKKAT
jgi:redox-sensitive bicupin YhaK (pirin superfamily)